MTPEELRRFAADYLEPRLPWLTRRDLPWTEPSDTTFVCATEFVLTPVGPIKCDFGMTAVPTDLGRGAVVNVGFGFTPLYVPFRYTFGVPLRRGRALSARWPLRAGAGEEEAIEFVGAIEARWPKEVTKMGTIDGLIDSIGHDADQDPEMLEVLGYSQALAGDEQGALRSLRKLRRSPLSETDAGRVSEMEGLLESNSEMVLNQLASWRAGRLRELGLLAWAAPWHPGSSAKKS
jgi:hypothetical protein